jgi:hypothetical protein
MITGYAIYYSDPYVRISLTGDRETVYRGDRESAVIDTVHTATIKKVTFEILLILRLSLIMGISTLTRLCIVCC